MTTQPQAAAHHHGHPGHHTVEKVRALAKQIEGLHGHKAKVAATFDAVHDMIIESRDACLANGATAAQLAPITATADMFAHNKDEFVKINLL